MPEENETIWKTDEIAELKQRIKTLEEMVGTLTIEVGKGKPEGLSSAIDTKVSEVGGRYWSAQTGARTMILPDNNTGIQIIDDAGNDVFKVLVDGADVGDVIIGDYASNQGAKYDKSAGTFDFKGVVTAASGTIGGWTINATSIYTGTEDHSGYTANAGDITLYSDGVDASIHGNKFYVDNTGKLTCTDIVATGTINAQAGYLSAGVYVDTANGLLCESGGINVGVSGHIRGGQTDYAIGTGVFLGYSGGDYKFSLGGTTNYLRWNGTHLILKGSFDVGTAGLINNGVYTVATLPIPPTSIGFEVPSAYE